MIKVFIVDDHQLVIDGLELMLAETDDIKVVGSALNAESAQETLKETEADVVLLDINMPGMNGVDLCKVLHKDWPDLKILALSMIKEVSLIKMMLKNGAKGYLVKNASREEVKDAIRNVHEGNKFLSEEVNSIILDSLTGTKKKEASPFPKLSRREKEIMQLILEEMTTQEIATKLFISFGTVETHRRNMMIKLGTRNTAGLVKTVMEYNLVD